MAYCEFCRQGIGPKSGYELIFHPKGIFGTHSHCKELMLERLNSLLDNKITRMDDPFLN